MRLIVCRCYTWSQSAILTEVSSEKRRESERGEKTSMKNYMGQMHTLDRAFSHCALFAKRLMERVSAWLEMILQRKRLA